MKKPVVYLAGKMAGLTYKQMTEWRSDAAYLLRLNGFVVMDPTTTVPNEQFTNLASEANVIPCNEIVDNNMYQIMQSDIVLAELTYEPTSIGTCGEIIFAALNKIPVITWGENSVCEHPWIKKHTSAHRDSFSEALEHIVQAYGGAI